jgi:hypothetical protein
MRVLCLLWGIEKCANDSVAAHPGHVDTATDFPETRVNAHNGDDDFEW